MTEAALAIPFAHPRAPDDPHADAALVARRAERMHLFETRAFMAAASGWDWDCQPIADGLAAWTVGDSDPFVLFPRVVPIARLRRYVRLRRLSGLRLELGPVTRLVDDDGGTADELVFDPARPDAWLEHAARHGLVATDGCWSQTRTLVTDLAGGEAAVFARLPADLRSKLRAFQRRPEVRVETVPGPEVDAARWRAVEELHAVWCAIHPETGDNLRFARPLVMTLGADAALSLAWQGDALAAVVVTGIAAGVVYTLFSERAAFAVRDAVHGLVWQAFVHAMTRGADLADRLGAHDPRYSGERDAYRGFTAAKLAWHPTSVYTPPAVILGGGDA